MGAPYEAEITLKLRVHLESPEGPESVHRAADLVDVIIDKLPPSGKIYRSRRDGASHFVRGNPIIVSVTGTLDSLTLRAPTGPGTGRKPTMGHEEAKEGP